MGGGCDQQVDRLQQRCLRASKAARDGQRGSPQASKATSGLLSQQIPQRTVRKRTRSPHRVEPERSAELNSNVAAAQLGSRQRPARQPAGQRSDHGSIREQRAPRTPRTTNPFATFRPVRAQRNNLERVTGDQGGAMPQEVRIVELHRLGEQVTLGVVSAKLVEVLELLDRFDTFGNDGEPQ